MIDDPRGGWAVNRSEAHQTTGENREMALRRPDEHIAEGSAADRTRDSDERASIA